MSNIINYFAIHAKRRRKALSINETDLVEGSVEGSGSFCLVEEVEAEVEKLEESVELPTTRIVISEADLRKSLEENAITEDVSQSVIVGYWTLPVDSSFIKIPIRDCYSLFGSEIATKLNTVGIGILPFYDALQKKYSPLRKMITKEEVKGLKDRALSVSTLQHITEKFLQRGFCFAITVSDTLYFAGRSFPNYFDEWVMDVWGGKPAKPEAIKIGGNPTRAVFSVGGKVKANLTSRLTAKLVDAAKNGNLNDSSDLSAIVSSSNSSVRPNPRRPNLRRPPPPLPP